MNGGAVALPSLDKVAAALRNTTEILAREITTPTDQPPPWSEFEWRIARAVVTMQGIAPILLAGLRWSRPASWRRFLCEQRDHVAGRYRRIVDLLQRIDSKARGEGIAVVALKGVSLHARGIYEAGERPMADIDLLVKDADVEAMTRLLETCDFEVTFTTWRHRLFEPRGGGASMAFGEHVDNPIKVELHTTIRERLPITEVDITRFVLQPELHPGLNDYCSPAILMMHLLLHAAGNIRAHALRHIQLHDIACLATRFGSSDWQELLTARPNSQGLWWALTPLTLTAHYYPGTIPGNITTQANTESPWLLRKVAHRLRLSDVSWSNIKVYAFPGIEWSRSPAEALRFIVGRVWPSREAKLELRDFDARHPGSSVVKWYGISQIERILRWIFLRPRRVQTLLAVRAALAQTE
jgi:Uncharacterised nucleotidyltransferase